MGSAETKKEKLKQDTCFGGMNRNIFLCLKIFLAHTIKKVYSKNKIVNFDLEIAFAAMSSQQGRMSFLFRFLALSLPKQPHIFTIPQHSWD